MSIADLRNRVTIQSKSKTADGIGGYTTYWTSGDTVWANIETTNSSEKNVADRIAANASHKVTIRYRTDITEQMRLSFNGRTYAIQGLKPDTVGKAKYLVIFCNEGDAP